MPGKNPRGLRPVPGKNPRGLQGPTEPAASTGAAGRFTCFVTHLPEEFRTKEYNNKFKTSRLWFTFFDVQIFRMFGVPFELVDQENNCIMFQDYVESDFEWMEKVNEMKQECAGYKRDILKQLLSSTWGAVCGYEKQPLIAPGQEIPAKYSNKTNLFIGEIESKYFFAVDPETGNNEYINPNQRYKFALGIIKPFVLAYARLRLLEQIKKLQDAGKKVVYAHTDSIITNGGSKYFDIGTQIGEYKKETTSTIGVEIKNIASKKFLE